jgi:hypothetical protein
MGRDANQAYGWKLLLCRKDILSLGATAEMDTVCSDRTGERHVSPHNESGTHPTHWNDQVFGKGSARGRVEIAVPEPDPADTAGEGRLDPFNQRDVTPRPVRYNE